MLSILKGAEEHSLEGEGPAELTIKGLGGGLLC